MRKYFILLGVLILWACGNDEYQLSQGQLYTRASSAATDHNEIITSIEEIIDLTAEVLNDKGIGNGRSSSGRWSTSALCTPSADDSYLIDQTHYDTTLYIGTMTLNYGGGSCINSAIKRSGKIIDDFEYILNYETQNFWSKETITFDSFKKDSVTIDGTFVITSKSGEPVTLETANATITYEDGRYAAWKGTLDFASINEDGLSTSNTITGSIAGITKRSENFESSIITPIVYNYKCENLINPVPVRGSIQMQVNGEQSIINYGDGSCDSAYKLTVNQKQTEHPL